MIENEFWLRGSSGSFAEHLLLAFHLYRLVLHALLWLVVLLSRWAAVTTRDGVTLAVLQKCVDLHTSLSQTAQNIKQRRRHARVRVLLVRFWPTQQPKQGFR